MQEHPFFSRPQIFFGNPELEEEERIDNVWGLCLESIQPKQSKEKTGLIFLWTEEPSSDESIYLEE